MLVDNVSRDTYCSYVAEADTAFACIGVGSIYVRCVSCA